jgi:hypothetical protein
MCSILTSFNNIISARSSYGVSHENNLCIYSGHAKRLTHSLELIILMAYDEEYKLLRLIFVGTLD